MDVLTDVLRTLRLRGTVYFQADFGAPWGMDIKGGAFANFHLVVKGSCWLRWANAAAPIALGEGDLIVFPHGDAHALVHTPDGDAPPAEEVLAEPAPFGGAGAATTLICGHFEYDRAGAHPFIEALPHLIHLARTGDSEWINTLTRMTVSESTSGTLGSGAIVDRLSEVLLLQVLRAHVEAASTEQGFIAALTDPAISTALTCIHTEPERDWSLNDLARRAAVSRTVFAERFKTAVGSSPKQYMTLWRMHRARALLREEGLSIAEVADRVGYRSEWSFAKAFKRVFDVGPGAVRRSAQRSA